MRSSIGIATCGVLMTAAMQAQPSAVTLPPGTSLKTLATHDEQGVTSPVSLAFDDQGRLFLAETLRFTGHGVEDDRDHPEWYLDDLASKSVADRLAMYEKWKEKTPLARYTERSERVRLLSAADADGVFRKNKVFADGFNAAADGTASGIFAYEGTAYFGCIPKIYALRDDNGDDVAEQKSVIEEGFGVKVSLSGHDLHGFTLAADGRIYGTIGDRGMQLKATAGRTFDLSNQGAVFRFDPDGSNFEIVHRGLRNPKGIAFDEAGNAVVVDNNSDQGDQARVVLVAEGGDSGWTMERQAVHSFYRQLGLTDAPPNGWMSERMWQPANAEQPAFMVPPLGNLTAGPSGIAYHPGAGFLESEAGRFQVGDYGGAAANSGIWSFKLAPDGAGMKMVDSRRLLWGVPVSDLTYAPDGRLVVSDFGGGWISHEAGRVLSIDAGSNRWREKEANEAATILREGFEQRTSQQLQSLMRHADWRVRVRAELALTRKPDALQRLKEAVKSEDAHERMHAVWALGVMVRRGSAALPAKPDAFAPMPNMKTREDAAQELVALLAHQDAEIRAQAMLGLGGYAANRSSKEILKAALPWGLSRWLIDPSPRVRYATAIAIGKLRLSAEADSLLETIATEKKDDPYLRHAYAYALANAMNLSNFRYLAEHESPAVRLTAVIALRHLRASELAIFVNDTDLRVSGEAIRAIHDLGLDEARPAVAALLDEPLVSKRSALMQLRQIHSAFRIGDEENLRRLEKVAANKSLPDVVRAEAVRLIGVWANPPSVDQSTGRWAPLPKRDAAPAVAMVKASLAKWFKGSDHMAAAALMTMQQYEGSDAAVPDAALKELIARKALPVESREIAFNAYVKRGVKGLDAVCGAIIKSPSDAMATAAARHWLQVDRAKALPVITEVAVKGSATQRQAAWSVITGIDDPTVSQALVTGLKQLVATKGVSAWSLELLEAARKSVQPAVQEAMKAYDASWQGDSIGYWLPELEGGDAVRGEKVVYSHPAGQCMRCHTGIESAAVGPNLAGIGLRRTPHQLLESLLEPSAALSPAYGKVSVTLKNQQQLEGSVTAETAVDYELTTADKKQRLRKSDVASLAPIGPAISPMPAMKMLLSPAERRDVVAWLISQQDNEKLISAEKKKAAKKH